MLLSQGSGEISRLQTKPDSTKNKTLGFQPGRILAKRRLEVQKFSF